MEPQTFRETLKNSQPEADWSPYLQALWYDAKGFWDKAHALIEHLPDQDASLLHAYLHRREGDDGNARYWYARAGTRPFTGSMEEEWESLVTRLI